MAKYKAKGVVVKYGDSAAPSTTIPALAEISFEAGQWDRNDITTHDTAGITKNYDVTLKEPSSVDVRLLLDPADTAHAWLISSHISATVRYMTLVLPDGGSAQWAMTGHVTNLSIGGLTPSGHIEASFTFSSSVADTFTA